MSTLILWLSLSVGCMIGIPIGYFYGWTNGHARGVQIGQEDSKAWRAACTPDYTTTLPHGHPEHTCSLAKCGPRV